MNFPVNNKIEGTRADAHFVYGLSKGPGNQKL
ncbi:hypothetical protein LKACC16343_02717 [Companilactobacillus bobalius]|uniref:Uncharacterized protein n=1 Tax=Companilactobacillus bobalius TaxID=2801451 RepID=A0A202F404_9LACO|nr:hypothetical protein LKACC16343_02717 [Companilactobacillus bobalius]